MRNNSFDHTEQTCRKPSHNWAFRYYGCKNGQFLPVPQDILFCDQSCSIARLVIDLSGWSFYDHESKLRIFLSIGNQCSGKLEGLKLDYCEGINPNEDLSLIRGKLSNLKELSLAAACPSFLMKSGPISFGIEAALAICSFKSILCLNLSDNKFSHQESRAIFVSISESLCNMQSLMLARCEGITDPCLRALGQCIQRFRKLARIDLSQCADDFSDDGLVDLISAVT